jgi:hypothetical protein
MFLVGAIGGRHDRITRQMAVVEAQKDSAQLSEELKSRLKSKVSLVLNFSMLAAIYIVLAMMVFQPGEEEDDHE